MANTSNTNTKFVSFNCKSMKRSQECIRSLCQSADLIALQETWLLPHEIHSLGDIDRDFSYTGKSAVDTSSGPLRGRPYGGVAILWRRNVFSAVSVVQCNSDRITAIKINMQDRQLLIICVYMPTDSPDNLVEFSECMSEIVSIVENNNIESVFMLGDFNANPGEPFGREMESFCSDQNWLCVDLIKLGRRSGEYTYVSEIHGTTSWLDHCLATEAAMLSVVDSKVRYGVYWSDHYPLEIVCN